MLILLVPMSSLSLSSINILFSLVRVFGTLSESSSSFIWPKVTTATPYNVGGYSGEVHGVACVSISYLVGLGCAPLRQEENLMFGDGYSHLGGVYSLKLVAFSHFEALKV